MLEREIEIRNQKTGRVLTYFRATYDKVRGGGGQVNPSSLGILLEVSKTMQRKYHICGF